MSNKKKISDTELLENSSLSKSTSEDISENTTKTVEQKSKKREFKDSDYIMCRSVWSGGLNVTSRFGTYEFKKYGSDCEIEYRDLIYLARKHSDHIFTPRFVILDEDFLSEFPQIQRVYSEMYTMSDLRDILDLPISQMRAEIEKLPDVTKKTLANLTATEIATGHLDSIKKVKALSEIFNSDFNLLSQLFVK